MLRLKGCPRCHGDLYPDLDDEWSCIQYGNRLTTRPAPRRTMPLRRLGPPVAAPAVRPAVA
jgi:hypothetical protein